MIDLGVLEKYKGLAFECMDYVRAYLETTRNSEIATAVVAEMKEIVKEFERRDVQ